MTEYLYPHMVQEYYVARLRELRRRRDEERGKIRTPAQVQRLREQVRRKLRACFGKRPRKTPLNARVTGRLERELYTVEKVMYESRPGLVVTANLYLPHGREWPRPAVLGACGHAAEGKACPLYQAFSQHLARQGYVVFTYDPLSQGERLQYPKHEGVCQPKGCCQEHNMMGNPMRLMGDYFGLWRAWDGIRGLDYLLSRPEVDPQHVGVTGNSGGGTLSTYLTALDDRFTMAAPSCFVTTYLNDLENELPADAEQIPPGILAAGLDMADFFVAQIPRPTLLLGKKNDYFDTRGLERTCRELKRLYAILGVEDKIQLFIGPGNHGYHQENREAMYRFFNEQVGQKGKPKEPDIPAEDEVDLWATPKGQVHFLRQRRVFDFTSANAREIAATRKAPARFERTLAKILALPKRNGPPHYRIMRARASASKKCRHHSSFAVETEPGIQAILHLFSSRQVYFHFPEATETTLYVPHTSSTEELVKGQTPRGEKEFFSVDVRGIGQTRALTCANEDVFAPYGNDYFYASHGEMLKESYAGRRVHDVLSTLDLFQAQGRTRVHLVGRGLGAITAAFAACLHPLVKRVTLHNALLSYHELTQAPVQCWPLSSLVCDILHHLDLPDCYRALYAKGLAIIRPWDSQMRPWRPERLRPHLKELGLSSRRVRMR